MGGKKKNQQAKQSTEDINTTGPAKEEDAPVVNDAIPEDTKGIFPFSLTRYFS